MNLHPRHPPYLGLYHHLQCQEAGSVGASWADKTYSYSHIALHLLVACLWIVVSTFLWGKNMVILIIILLRHMILFRSFPPLFFFQSSFDSVASSFNVRHEWAFSCKCFLSPLILGIFYQGTKSFFQLLHCIHSLSQFTKILRLLAALSNLPMH